MIKDRIEKSWLRWIKNKWVDKRSTTAPFSGGYVSALRDFENYVLESNISDDVSLLISNLMIDFKE